MALLPRRKWTNKLAWSVWAQRRNNKRRAGGVTPPVPPLNERYFTILDGQSKFWRRDTPWACVDPVVEITFLGNTIPDVYMLFDGVASSDRMFLYSEASDGILKTNAETIQLNGVDIPKGTQPAVEKELNTVSVVFSGSFRLQVVGTRFSKDGLFAPTIVTSIKLVDPSDPDNTFVYPMDKNLPYELPVGEVLGSELWSGSDSVGAGWIDNGDGSYSSDGTTTDSFLMQSIPAVLTGNYVLEVSFVVSDYSSGGVRSVIYGVDGVAVGTTVSSDGLFTESVGRSSNTIFAPNKIAMQADPTFNGKVSDISFRVIPDSALIFENGEVDGSDRIPVREKSDNTGFLGQDGWGESIKSVSGQAAAPTANSIAINETTNNLAAVGISFPAMPVTISGVADITSGQVDISVIPGFSGVAASINQSGEFSFDLVSQGAVNFKRAFGSGAVALITDIKVQVRYDYAEGVEPAGDYSDAYSSAYS